MSAPEDRQMAAQAVQLTSKVMKRSCEDASKTAAITSSEKHRPSSTYESKLFRASLILLCHKSSFSLTLMRPQQGHCPRRSMSA